MFEKILNPLYDALIKKFPHVSRQEWLSANCKFWSHLIYFEFLKLKTCDLKTKYIPPFCTEYFVHLTF